MRLSPHHPVKLLVSQEKRIGLEKPVLVGILNVTPDSFSNDGLMEPNQALEHARKMTHNGVDWTDIGGESSGPRSIVISVEEEIHRIVPIIEFVKKVISGSPLIRGKPR